MYFGAGNLNPPADYNLILVSGAQIKSWPGILTTATTTIAKANNTTNLDNGASWVGGVDPGLYNLAVWNSTVAAANTTATLASSQQWAGLKVVNPGGPVTLNGGALLGLDDSGVDMTTATQDLTVNCPVGMAVPSTLGVAPGRTATFNGIISGYPGLTVNGGGTVQLNAANTYSGDTTVNSGTLVANNNSALGSGLLVLDGGNLSNSSSCAPGNGVKLNSNATVTVGAAQTLTLKGSIAGTGSLTKNGTGRLTLSGANTYTGATIVSAGTLAIGNPSALLPTSSLTLAAGALLQPNLDGVVIRAPVTVAGSGTPATISAPTNAPGAGVVSTLTLNSVLAGNGNVTFSSSVNQNALSTVYLGAQSTYGGRTLLDTAGTSATQIIVRLGIHNALPTTTVLTIDGQPGAGTGRFAELNLNGFNQQLAGLTNNPRSLRIQRIVNSNVSAAATLTIHNTGNHAFSGSLGGSAGGSVSASAMPGTTSGNNFGLMKGGAGTFTLTGPNSYSGNTTVSQGTLSLGAVNPGNENSSVHIADTGATLNLTFAGTDTVAKLFTGATERSPGTYGAVGAAAPVIGIPQITGTGTLTVTSGPPAGYAGWALAVAGGQSADLDFDGDGVVNGVEYVLGGTATSNDLAKLPAVSTAGGNMVFTFVRDQASIDGITALAIETSSNLADWTTTYPVADGAVTRNPGVSVTKDEPPGYDTVTLTLPVSDGLLRFFRLRMTP
jgi:autotransporter-associated beta strand protein